MPLKNFPIRLAALAVLGVLTACGDSRPDGLTGAQPSSTASVALMSCPTSESHAGSGRIPASGGTLRLGGHSVVVPGTAIVDSIEISAEAAAGSAVILDLRANGQEHWQFLDRLVVTIDYSRCNPSAYAGRQLTVWLVDPETGAPTEFMGGVDDRASRRITFQTDHFSGYAIAN